MKKLKVSSRIKKDFLSPTIICPHCGEEIHLSRSFIGGLSVKKVFTGYEKIAEQVFKPVIADGNQGMRRGE